MTIKHHGCAIQTVYEENDPKLEWLGTIRNFDENIFSRGLHHSQRRELRNVFLEGSVYHVSANRIKFKEANVIIDRFDNNDDDITISDISAIEREEIIRASVSYFDETKRVKYTVQIEEGAVLSNKTALPTGSYIFALNEDMSELCLAKKEFHDNGNIQHSSFYAGQAVSSSGYMSIKEGNGRSVVCEIEMSSGHYRPSKNEAYVILKFLHFNKTDLNSVSIIKPYNQNSIKHQIYSACVDLSKRDDGFGEIGRITITIIKHRRLMTGLEYIEYFERKNRAFCNLVIMQLMKSA